MKQKDAELIQRILAGDQDAFTPLVNKYQKGVHALAWRKIGDFHIAQEITQDAFLKAYQKLGTLKSYELFGGWLYVIASNLCLDYLRKNPPPEQSLEVTDVSEVNQVSYSRYIAGKQTAEADEARREVVKELLQKLPESERTVMTLHYLGEMTIKTISEFLGVSPNTVKSRLSRARNRLKKEEDMIRQNLGSFQLPANLTETIMREVSRIVPTGPAASKPVLPWALSAASAVLIVLLMGVGTQYLSRFQKPYNLNATSAPTVDLIEALFVVDTPAKPAVRNQAGSSATPGRNPGSGQQPDARLFAAAVDAAEELTPTPQWAQTKGPEGGIVNNFFTTNAGDIYAGTSTSLYKLGADGRAWRRVNARKLGSLSIQDWLGTAAQMAAHGNRLYLATDTEILASEDKGETWHALGTHPKGIARGFAVTDSGFYLALTGGVYYSKDGKTSWAALKDGMAAERILALAAIGNTVFAGTDKGLYRLNIERWKLLQVPVGPADMHGRRPVIHALAASKNRLYVAAGEASTYQSGTQITSVRFWWTLHRSTDLGDSWYPIDPRGTQERETGRRRGQSSMSSPLLGSDNIPLVKIVATGASVTVTVADGECFYSTNTGETWTTLEKDASDSGTAPPLLIADTNIFYKSGLSGILRTTDGGESWHPFNTGFVSTPVTTLIAVKGRLYANSIDLRYVTSTDGGESWMPLPKNIDYGVFIAAFDDSLYVKTGDNMNLRSPLLRLSIEDNSLNFIPGMPGFEGSNSGNKVQAEIDVPEEMMITVLREVLQESFPDTVKQNIEDLDLEQVAEMLKGIDIDPEQLNEKLTEKLNSNPDFARLKNEALNKATEEHVSTGMSPSFGNFAVSGETYYVEYGQKLFRWEPDMTEWHDTGLIDETEFDFPVDYSVEASTSINVLDSIGFKIAVSGSTVYVGKRDGHLAQSFDKGETWDDITADLPFSFTEFKAIVFAGSTVYVTTDKGVAHSSDGTRWHAVTTDTEGETLIMERLAAEGATVYGTTGEYVYQLKEGSNTWEQVTPEIPDTVLSFAVHDNVLYVGTASSSVLRFTLEE